MFLFENSKETYCRSAAVMRQCALGNGEPKGRERRAESEETAIRTGAISEATNHQPPPANECEESDEMTWRDVATPLCEKIS